MDYRGGLQAVLDGAFVRLASFSTAHPWWIIALSLIALVAGLYGASFVRQDNSLDAYFNEDDASYAAYKRYIEEFSSDEVIYLLYAAPETEHGPFDLKVMQQIAHLTETIEREVPFVRKVTSLANVEFIESEGDLVEIHGLMSDFPDDQEELLRLRSVALSKPLYVNAIVSPDGRYGAVVAEMSRTSTDPVERLRLDPDGGDAMGNLYPQVSNTAVRKILQREDYQGIDFWLSGDVAMNSTYNEVVTADTATITLLTVALIALVGVFVFRTRWLGLTAPLLIVGLSLVMMMGLMGLMGWRINLFFLMIPTLLCAVGVAQAVHVLFAWQEQRQQGQDPAQAVRRAIGKVATPCLLAATTTAVGFLGMSGSNLRAISEVAQYSAFGVICTFFLSLSLLIVFAARSQGDAAAVIDRKPDGPITRLTTWLAEFNLRRSGLVLCIFGALLLGAGAGIARLKVDFNFLEEFKPSLKWRADTEHINSTMGGLLSLVYQFDAGQADGIQSVALLREIESLQALAESTEVAQDSISVVDIVKELHQAFHGGDPAYYRLPDDDATLAQLLLVYELSGGKEMNDVLNIDRSKTALQIRLKLVAASKVRAFLDHMDRHLAEHPVERATVEVSGIGLLWVRMADYITESQIKGYALVFSLISLMMILAFGSVRVGLFGMIPNLFPIVMAMGLMGWMHWHLDYLRLLLATIAIGIAVDDTVHMMARLKSEFAEHGRYELALTRAIRGVGPAMIATTLILVVAVSSFLISQMSILTSFGILLGLTMLAALLADLFLLPALVLKLRPFGAERVPQDLSNSLVEA